MKHSPSFEGFLDLEQKFFLGHLEQKSFKSGEALLFVHGKVGKTELGNNVCLSLPTLAVAKYTHMLSQQPSGSSTTNQINQPVSRLFKNCSL